MKLKFRFQFVLITLLKEERAEEKKRIDALKSDFQMQRARSGFGNHSEV